MTSFGQHYVVPAAGRYQERYPDVHIELTLAQRMPDLLDEGFDVSLTLKDGSTRAVIPDLGFSVLYLQRQPAITGMFQIRLVPPVGHKKKISFFRLQRQHIRALGMKGSGGIHTPARVSLLTPFPQHAVRRYTKGGIRVPAAA